jgi:hypothetical protein
MTAWTSYPTDFSTLANPEKIASQISCWLPVQNFQLRRERQVKFPDGQLDAAVPLDCFMRHCAAGHPHFDVFFSGVCATFFSARIPARCVWFNWFRPAETKTKIQFSPINGTMSAIVPSRPWHIKIHHSGSP